MPQLQSFLKHEVPRDLATQIRSGIRMIWPGLNPGVTKIWSPLQGAPSDRMTFVLVEDELLISHAEVNFRKLDLKGNAYEIGGLSAVFTYPSHRGTGAGEQVVRAATGYLAQSKADLALLFCGERVQSLYARTGWTLVPNARVLFGDKSNPTLEKCLTMALTITDSGRRARAVFESQAVYVGPSTW
jgi:hypothetical protein